MTRFDILVFFSLRIIFFLSGSVEKENFCVIAWNNLYLTMMPQMQTYDSWRANYHACQFLSRVCFVWNLDTLVT